VSKGGKDRANAKRIVEQQKAAERRRRVTIWTSVAVVAVLLVAGLIGWRVVAAQDKTTAGTVVVPSGAVDEGTAFAVGTGPVVVDLYEDFMCPICHSFEDQTGPTIKQLVADKKITVRYHPVSILDDRSSGTQYSTRAGGAAAAAAVDGKFLEYHDVLYAHQPEENSSGLTDAQLIEYGKSVGLGDKFATAVNDKTYDSWVTQNTDKFSARHFTGTPTIVVAGQTVEGPGHTLPTTEVFTQAVDKAAG
jgi:protein-disulfide isomerase